MKPTAAPAHRTMAEVLRDERLGCQCQLPRLRGHKPWCPLSPARQAKAVYRDERYAKGVGK